ncbi:hypothetical protein [Ralstonia pseudosolanacearum]|uniref:Uncharacterized protein n=1 Tax=Ralstonia solanacearum TaxID=305 RepID=A0AA92EA66_RALSL|nr:hypothetical protein [Ralstonia pseudosolanacearum]QCX48143.1 hypothetical protein E7Z57_02945 [Ralstonia pseudosolanacearum]
MMATDSLHVVVHPIVPSGMFFCWLSPCRCVCNAGADTAYRAPHFAQQLTWFSHVQASCLERARPMAVVTFPGVLAASSAAPPGRRRLERKRQAKAEGKIKGRGTQPLENPVCTWRWRGTRLGAAACRESAQYRVGIGESACFARPAALVLDGGAV